MSAAGYVAPSTLDQVSEILRGEPNARVLAGGSNLLLPAHRTQIAGAILVDLSRVKELDGIALRADGGLQIGSMTTLNTLILDEVAGTQYPALRASVQLVGDAQLRNRATVGGSLAEAHPESDLAALFLALDATVSVKSGLTERSIPIAEFYTEASRTDLMPQEVITLVTVPAAIAGASLVYERIKHPATLYALSGVAVYASKTNAGEIETVRVGATGVLTFPARLFSVEKALTGKAVTETTIAEAVSKIPADVRVRSDLFGSGDYRRHLLQVLTRRALQRALSVA